jgi:hypothetical protein
MAANLRGADDEMRDQESLDEFHSADGHSICITAERGNVGTDPVHRASIVPMGPVQQKRTGFTAYFALSPVTGLSCYRHP